MGDPERPAVLVRWWSDFWINLQHPAVTFFWALVASAETLIALALTFGFARKVPYIAAIAFSVLIWSAAEGFGGPYASGACDIGTAIIYAVVFTGRLALSYSAGPVRYRAATTWRRRSPGGSGSPGSAARTPAAAARAPQDTIPPMAVPGPPRRPMGPGFAVARFGLEPGGVRLSAYLRMVMVVVAVLMTVIGQLQHREPLAEEMAPPGAPASARWPGVAVASCWLGACTALIPCLIVVAVITPKNLKSLEDSDDR
jgi:uncharacterized membrane protein YphA (DoxX/SURF4 family)